MRKQSKVDGGPIDVDSIHLGLILMSLTRRFQRMHDEKTDHLETLGLRASHGGVLTNLAQRPHRLSELAEINKTRPQSMVKIVNELESLEYVERIPDSSDSRAKLVRFTPKGRDMLRTARSTTDEIYQLYAEIVGEKELQSMLHTMSKLISGLDEIHSRTLSPERI